MFQSPEGLLLIDKPAGVTSFDCVAAVRRRLGVKRVGHCGTLDPMAKGLLLVLVGPATRHQDEFLGLQKEYVFKGEFGRQMSTGDLEGEVIEKRAWDHVTQAQLEATISQFIGVQQQTPPAYAALKYKGRPYYEYARKGVQIPRPAREITIYSFSLLAWEPPFWKARVVCSRGTYIRTLVEDVAARLGTCATMVDLVRERIGTYVRTDACPLHELPILSDEQLATRLQRLSSGEAAIHA